MVEHFLRYAALGWPVVPVRTGEKRPNLTAHGSRDASTDPDVIRNWCEHWPQANIGLALGPLSGIAALDIDSPAEEQRLRGLVREHDRLPRTAINRTPRGYHLLFRAPDVRLRQGLGLRGDGLIVVLPPSVHPSGHRYRWHRWQWPLGELPNWLMTKSAAPTNVRQECGLESSIAPCDLPEPLRPYIPQTFRIILAGGLGDAVAPRRMNGSRNRALFAFACFVVEAAQKTAQPLDRETLVGYLKDIDRRYYHKFDGWYPDAKAIGDRYLLDIAARVLPDA